MAVGVHGASFTEKRTPYEHYQYTLCIHSVPQLTAASTCYTDFICLCCIMDDNDAS